VSFDDIKREVAIGNRVLSHIGLCAGVDLARGHVSLRVPDEPDKFVVKGRGYEVDVMPVMKAKDMVVCDLDGNKVEGPPEATQCWEVKIHSAIYKNYPNVQSVIHVHPRHTVLMSILGATLVPMCREGHSLLSQPLPVWPHFKLVTSDQDGEEVAALMARSKVALLFGHGVVATGSTISESVVKVYELEEQAKMNYMALNAMGMDFPRIPQELLEESREAPEFWELPHFQSSFPPDTTEDLHPSIDEGPYKYWASLVEEDV